jgi:hypothetical protein
MSPQVEGRLAVREEADRVLVVREDDPDDWLCAFSRADGFPALRWAQDMARTYNARLEGSLSSASIRRRPGASGP